MEVSFELNKMNEASMKEVYETAEKINYLEMQISAIRDIKNFDTLVFQGKEPCKFVGVCSCLAPKYIRKSCVTFMDERQCEAIKQFIIGYKRSEIDSLENKLLAMGVKVRRDSND